MNLNLFNIMAGTSKDLCTSETGYRLFGLAGYGLKFIQIAVPIILIVMGTIDLVKAMVAQSDDKIKKAQGILIKRAISAVVIFFVPIIVFFAIGLLGESTSNECITSFQNPGDAIAKANHLKQNHSSYAGNKILSEESCRAKGGTLITNQEDINMNGTNCINIVNLDDQIERVN